ncbi:MAG: outer membrane beta-barrel protein [Bacteroidales bacterium]|nr:outer membrane beta-barrel protein [Candidatus Liminaster caballi]
MKTTKSFFALVAAVCISVVSAFAQDVTDNYSRIYASYGFQSMKNQTDSDKGAQLGLLYGLNLTGNSAPLFFQLGAELNWVTYSEDELRETLVNVAVPLNLSYKIAFSDNVSLEPYAGLNLRLNVMGSLSADGSDEKIDYFEDLDAKRFQLGLNVGASININNISLGYRFNPDLTDYFDIDGTNSKTRYHFISLGINF